MKKEDKTPHKFQSLTELHRLVGLPEPMHPLISLIENQSNEINLRKFPGSFTHDFYKVSYKKNLRGKLKYGQGFYDFDEGGLLFKAPNQVSANAENNNDHTGFTLLFHPDFLAGIRWQRKLRNTVFFPIQSMKPCIFLKRRKPRLLPCSGTCMKNCRGGLMTLPMISSSHKLKRC